MAVIELTDVLFYKNGDSDNGEVSGVVGYEDSSRRVARYTFTAPDTGAQRVKLTFQTSGRGAGSHIPIRYYIGTDPESHVNAGAESEYTGELTLDTVDYVVFSGSADILLLPGVTYYLWVFPGKDIFGWYWWSRSGYTSTAETEGAAFVVPVIHGGKWWNTLVHCIHNRKWWLGALCVVKGGRWYLGGSGKTGSGGWYITARAEGDAILITTSLPVSTMEDAIIIGGA